MASDDDTAARLAALHTYFREHPETGPSDGRRATRVDAPAPLDLGTLDHIQASIQEIAAHTRSVNPEADPLPARIDAVYDWCRRNTQHTSHVQQQRRETVIYRQRLDHAIRAGDYTVIRPHRCPTCRTFGLMWVPEMERAVCTNTRCTDPSGLSSNFTLARLAYVHVAAQWSLGETSAT